MRATFKKHERLTSKKLIASLFSEGESFGNYPFRVIWIFAELPSHSPAQIVISVPKRKVKTAVGRNRIKRLMREVYRKHKNIPYDTLVRKQKQCALMLMYTGDGTVDYKEAEQKIILILNRLVKKWNSASETRNVKSVKN